jgi:prolycopene isomerase
MQEHVIGRFDVAVIGASLSGLSAAALLCKRGLSVAVVDRNYMPGGACSSMRRGDSTIDLGAAMLYGFGDRGFNPHRWLMEELEEPIELVRHKELYRLNYGGKGVVFERDIEAFIDGLCASILPGRRERLAAFYGHLRRIYDEVIAPDPAYLSPSEMRLSDLMGGFLEHPARHIKTLALLFTSAERIFKRFLPDDEAVRFFNKLTSTYSYTTMRETPAMLVAAMFVDNHVGGSYYPLGGPQALASALERSIERRGGVMLYETEVESILLEGKRARGIRLAGRGPGHGGIIEAGSVIHSGSVWDLYLRLLPPRAVGQAKRRKIEALVPSLPSSVLYGEVRRSAIPADARPIEMIIGNPDAIDENDVTLYISSIDEPSLCPPDRHVFMLIGPSAMAWPSPRDEAYGGEAYRAMKAREAARMLGLVEGRFPGFGEAVIAMELGSPATIERYLGKRGGATAGPKHMIGQHLLRRQHARTAFKGLYCAGESTVMGTGTPAVTISGISAAEVILRDLGMRGFRDGRRRGKGSPKPGVVRIHERAPDPARDGASLSSMARRCLWCEAAPCVAACPLGLDLRGMARRAEFGNLEGARRAIRKGAPASSPAPCASCPALQGTEGEPPCMRKALSGHPVDIRGIARALG